MFNQKAVRCYLGGEQFMFVHQGGVFAQDSLEAFLQASFLEEEDRPRNFPWIGFVWSQRLNEWIFRGHFNNAQVHNFTSFAKVDSES